MQNKIAMWTSIWQSCFVKWTSGLLNINLLTWHPCDNGGRPFVNCGWLCGSEGVRTSIWRMGLCHNKAEGIFQFIGWNLCDAGRWFVIFFFQISCWHMRGFHFSASNSLDEGADSCLTSKGVFNQLSHPSNYFAPRSGKFFGYDQKGVKGSS